MSEQQTQDIPANDVPVDLSTGMSSQDGGTVPGTVEVDDETLSEAKRQGWVPQDQYDGPEGKWVDAETFVKRGKEINSLLRKDNEFLKRKVSEMESTMMEFKKFHADTEKRAYDRAMADLRQQKKEAISSGDGDKVLEIDDAIDDLKAQKASAPVERPSSQPDPIFAQWNEDNPWFGKDQELTDEANLIGEVIKRKQPTLVGESFLDEVTKRVKKAYPEKFANTNRNRPSPVEGTTAPSTSGAKAGKGFKDLPPDAQAACQKFEKQGLLTREQYLKEFFG